MNLSLNKYRIGKSFFLGLLAILVLLAVGCSSKGFTMFTTKVKVVISADDKINPNNRNEASPTVLRVYELRSRKEFDASEFFDVYDNEGKTLKDALLQKYEFTIKPGEKTEWIEYFHDDTQYLGVVAAFRKIDDAKWRAVYELRKTATNELAISLNGLTVSITKN